MPHCSLENNQPSTWFDLHLEPLGDQHSRCGEGAQGPVQGHGSRAGTRLSPARPSAVWAPSYTPELEPG